MSKLSQWYRQSLYILHHPREQLSRGECLVRFWLELAKHGRDDLRRHQAGELAASLAYRTLFGLLPFLVLALTLFRAFGAFDQVDNHLSVWVLEVLHLPATLADGSVHPTAQHLQDVLGTLIQRANGLRLQSIGFIGFLWLIWAAMRLLISVEKSFNTICRVRQRRSWLVRIPAYWAAMTLGPLLVWMSLKFSGQALAAATDIAWLTPLRNILAVLLGGGMTWVMFFLAYRLLPATNVKVKCAATGAIFATVGWETMKWLLRLYFSQLILDQGQWALYGSLALVPLFLFWVYVSWLIVLHGLAITYLLQSLPEKRQDWEQALQMQRHTPGATDVDLLLAVAAAAGEQHECGEVLSMSKLVKTFPEPPEILQATCRYLEQCGLLHQVDDEQEECYILAKSCDNIAASEIVALAQQPPKTGVGSYSLQQTHMALKMATAEMRLTDLMQKANTYDKPNER